MTATKLGAVFRPKRWHIDSHMVGKTKFRTDFGIPQVSQCCSNFLQSRTSETEICFTLSYFPFLSDCLIDFYSQVRYTTFVYLEKKKKFLCRFGSGYCTFLIPDRPSPIFFLWQVNSIKKKDCKMHKMVYRSGKSYMPVLVFSNIDFRKSLTIFLLISWKTWFSDSES